MSDSLKRIRFAAAVLGLVIGTATRSEADTNLVGNSGFETDRFDPWSWTIGTDSISSLVPHSGHLDAALQSNSFYGDPSWSQAVTGLTVGDTYTLSFYYLNSINNVGNELRVSFGGAQVFDVKDPHTGYLRLPRTARRALRRSRSARALGRPSPNPPASPSWSFGLAGLGVVGTLRCRLRVSG
jgi:hypothetical protein